MECCCQGSSWFSAFCCQVIGVAVFGQLPVICTGTSFPAVLLEDVHSESDDDKTQNMLIFGGIKGVLMAVSSKSPGDLPSTAVH